MVDEVRDVLEGPNERVAVGHVDREVDVVQAECDAGELARVERRRALLSSSSASAERGVAE